MFRVNNKDTIDLDDVSDFEHISYIFLLLLLLDFNR